MAGPGPNPILAYTGVQRRGAPSLRGAGGAGGSWLACPLALTKTAVPGSCLCLRPSEHCSSRLFWTVWGEGKETAEPWLLTAHARGWSPWHRMQCWALVLLPPLVVALSPLPHGGSAAAELENRRRSPGVASGRNTSAGRRGRGDPRS